MQPWHRVVTPRAEVREGRSFSPDEFAIALEQVVSRAAPADYADPAQFFERTYVTRALAEHVGMTLRRLSGQTQSAAPVTTLITQFGGGKTHTLTALYHLAGAGPKAAQYAGVPELLSAAGVAEMPAAKVAVFAGNAWDPREGRETPWIDIARQLAGARGVELLGPAAKTAPPGTDALANVFAAANAPALLLFDEALNFVNRHRNMAEHFYAFIQNISVATMGTTRAAAVISLPSSNVEMTDWDAEWQDRITKIIGRVAQDLIANDESEISEVVRRRLFDDLGKEQTRRRVANAYAAWCFERRERLPPEWTAIDAAASESRGRDFLRDRFEACYPFHPATLSVFQRKWRALPQFQQTRGALAMFAQWISIASRQQFKEARQEPLITLGSAPIDAPNFRAAILRQIGETHLDAAIDADITGEASHARALDADAKDALRDIHKRVGAAVLFESSGGQIDKTAHLPELRFALGEPDSELDTAAVDNAVMALARRGFFIRKVGADGYRIHHHATLRKVVADRRAALDDAEIDKASRRITREEFAKGAGGIPLAFFPEDSASVADTPRLTIAALPPRDVWDESGLTAQRLAEWTRSRANSNRLYPAAIVWCVKKPGAELRQSAAMMLAWQSVEREVRRGELGSEFERAELADLSANVRDAEDDARGEVWAGYRFAALADADSPDGGLRVIDLGAGHSSNMESLCGRVIAALKSEALLNESVSAGYVERHWPPALVGGGAWPLTGLRQSFLDGSLTRLLDPDATLRRLIAGWVESGEFGLASGERLGGGYARVRHAERPSPDEIAFEPGVFLLTRAEAERRLSPPPAAEPPAVAAPAQAQSGYPAPLAAPATSPASGASPAVSAALAATPPLLAPEKVTLRLTGSIPPDMWNRVGVSLVSKMRGSGGDLTLSVDLSVRVNAATAPALESDLRRALADLGITDGARLDAV